MCVCDRHVTGKGKPYTNDLLKVKTVSFSFQTVLNTNAKRINDFPFRFSELSFRLTLLHENNFLINCNRLTLRRKR